MTEFVLIILVAAGSWGTMTTVPGFKDRAQCEAAGAEVRKLSDIYRPRVVCVERRSPEKDE